MTAKFLSPEEKDQITGELAREEQKKLATARNPVTQALVHGRVWHLTTIFFRSNDRLSLDDFLDAPTA